VPALLGMKPSESDAVADNVVFWPTLTDGGALRVTVGGWFPLTGAPTLNESVGEFVMTELSVLVAVATKVCGPTVNPFAAETTMAEL
jgi:hypothetical protein